MRTRQPGPFRELWGMVGDESIPRKTVLWAVGLGTLFMVLSIALTLAFFAGLFWLADQIFFGGTL